MIIQIDKRIGAFLNDYLSCNLMKVLCFKQKILNAWFRETWNTLEDLLDFVTESFYSNPGYSFYPFVKYVSGYVER